MKKIKADLLKILNKCEKGYRVAVFVLVGVTLSVHPAFAAQPVLVSGTVKLFQTITTWLLAIIPVAAGAFLGYQALQKSLSEDHAIIAEKNRLMKNVLIGAAIAETASGLATAILSFYK